MRVSEPDRPVTAELVAVLAAVTHGTPRVLTTECARALPAGPFQPAHRSLQSGLRAWVEAQTHHPLGYVEQLYTFADQDRVDRSGMRVISVSYLGLTREAENPAATGPDEHGVPQVGWQDWYRYFPWEDWRNGPPDMIDAGILPRLAAWARAAPDDRVRDQRRQRIAFTFGVDGMPWNEDMILQRYELLFEAGLIPESRQRSEPTSPALQPDAGDPSWIAGSPMLHDHRRILATGIARLRAKIKYRPVVFELMPPEFTLSQLQTAVEALAGRELHTPNFRRLIAQQELVEATGDVASGGTGRPARLYRFRGDVRLERAIAGSKLPLARQP